jgi:hypothetical protein
MIYGVQVVYPLIIATMIILVVKLWVYRKKIHDKDQKLMQLYIDNKFINSLIVNILCNQDNTRPSLVGVIKDYFELDDIVVTRCSDLQYGNLTNITSFLSQKKLQEVMETYYNNNKAKQSKKITKMLEFLVTDYSEYILYIFFANEIDQESIICIKHQSNEITRDEVAHLNTAIHLLKYSLLTNITINDNE